MVCLAHLPPSASHRCEQPSPFACAIEREAKASPVIQSKYPTCIIFVNQHGKSIIILYFKYIFCGNRIQPLLRGAIRVSPRGLWTLQWGKMKSNRAVCLRVQMSISTQCRLLGNLAPQRVMVSILDVVDVSFSPGEGRGMS